MRSLFALGLIACSSPTSAGPQQTPPSPPAVVTASAPPPSPPAPASSAAPIDLSFVKPTDGFTVLAPTVLAVQAGLHEPDLQRRARLGMSSNENALGVVLRDDCVVRTPRIPIGLHLVGLLGGDIEGYYREQAVNDLADARSALAGTGVHTLDQKLAWSETLGVKLELGDGRTSQMFVVTGGQARKLSIPVKHLDDVALVGDDAYVVVGFLGEKASLAKLDGKTGTLVDQQRDRLVAIHPLAADLLLLRHSSKGLCLERLSSPTPLGCVQDKASRDVQLVLSPDQKLVSFPVGPKQDSSVVIELATGRTVQRVKDSDSLMQLANSGALALQPALGGPIRVAVNGTVTPTTSSGLLAGFRPNGELIAIDESALHRGQQCKLTSVVGTY